MADAQPVSLGKRLRQERELRHWTQEELAEKIGRSVPSINRWEHDRVEPQLDALKELTALFGKPPERWGTSRWNVPFLRNPYFTGREQLLSNLHRSLSADKTVTLSQSRAISGLGGIGKTQIAIEYAYRYAREYEAVLWVQADSHEMLVSEFAKLAQILDLPDKEDKDQWRIVEAVKRWLQEHRSWLLILDNADDLGVIADVLPRGMAGATLVTTRSQVTGKIARSISVEKLEMSEGIRFLLRRGTLLSEDEPLETVSAATRIAAQQLVEELAGLPLALDQAGAYLEETGCSLSEYLALYGRHHLALLKRKSSMVNEYPYTVANTWTLSFSQVEQANPAAADLLRVCAFLHPDAIPEEVLTVGAAVGPHLQKVASEPLLLNEAMQLLRRYSLVKRDAEAKLLNMHRLVQLVLKESMDPSTQRQWAERTVRAVAAAFPKGDSEAVEVADWPRYEQYLPHVRNCMELIDQYDLGFPEAAHLLNQAGSYLVERDQNSQAEPLCQGALAIYERVLGPQHPDTADSLFKLAVVYYNLGNYAQGEVLCHRALTIYEQVLGPQDRNTAGSLNFLAMFHYEQGKYAEAGQLFQRALAIREQALGPQHPTVISDLRNLAVFYRNQGKYAEAEPLLQRALTTYEQVLGPQHPDIAGNLNSLAILYRMQGKYAEAEPLFQRALAIIEKIRGPENSDIAFFLNNLALLYHDQGRYWEIEPLLQRALAIYEKLFGPEHLQTGETLNNLAILYRVQGKYVEAEPLFQRVLAIYEQGLGPEHPKVAYPLKGQADLYREQGKHAEAELHYWRALRIREQHLGPEHPDIGETLNNLALLFCDQSKYEQAESLLQRALAIFEKLVGPEHPWTATALDAQGYLALLEGRDEQAAFHLQRVLTIREQALGNMHPDVAETLQHLAELSEKQSKSESASTFYQRALAIREQALGAQHPKTTQTRTCLMTLLHAMG